LKAWATPAIELLPWYFRRSSKEMEIDPPPSRTTSVVIGE